MTLRNLGNEEAQSVTAKLRSGYSQFQITDSLGSFGTIPAGASRNNDADRFAAYAQGTIPPGTQVPCTLYVHSDNWAHDWIYVFTLTVGEQRLPPGTIIWGPKVCPGMPTDYGLYGLAYNTQDNLLYCCYFMNSTIYKYTSDSMLTAAGTIPAPQDSCTDIDYCAYDNTFWILANPQKTVYKITPTGTIVRQFSVAAVDYPVGVVEHDAEHKVYVTDRRIAPGGQQLIFVYDTLGTLLQTVNHPKNGVYGTRCLALDPGTPSNPPSLLNVYTWFNSGGTAIDSTCLYEVDRVGLTVLNGLRFTNTNWNVRGVEYDPRDASYWITIMQDNTGGNNRIFKIAGFNPPVGLAEESKKLPCSDRTLQAWPNPFRNSVVLHLGFGGERDAQVRIYDNTGRLVRSLAVSRQPTAEGLAMWDGNDDAGNAVVPGIYFCTVSGVSKAWTKVVLTR
ncbi:MAG: FlgD immunoglobulin-like domain containing protein [candidate division WOR-3 bacterium]